MAKPTTARTAGTSTASLSDAVRAAGSTAKPEKASKLAPANKQRKPPKGASQREALRHGRGD